MFAKKNLVAAAALLALAGAAQADVKLYGMVDMSMGSFEGAHDKNDVTKTNFRTTKIESGQMMTSYIGLSGDEDLGGGLKAGFALESFLGADTGSTVPNNAGQFWGRTSNVFLSGSFGTITLGQSDNPLFTSGYTYNPFGSSMTFSPTMRHLNYIGQTKITGAGAGFDTGWINSVAYQSPTFGGFSFIGQAAAKETTSTTPDAKNSYALAGTYANGPFAATLTYEKGGYSPSGTATGLAPSYAANDKVTDLGVSYDFGVVKLFGQGTYIKKTGDASSGTYLTVDEKDKIYQLGASVPVTEKASVLASFGNLKHTVAGVDGSTKNDIFSLGLDYNLSKRTDVYAVFTNERQTSLTSGQTYAFGLRHNF
jgi:predicted porin